MPYRSLLTWNPRSYKDRQQPSTRTSAQPMLSKSTEVSSIQPTKSTNLLPPTSTSSEPTGVFSTIANGVMQGVALGAGSAIGHRIIDTAIGPPTLHLRPSMNGAENPVQQPPSGNPPLPTCMSEWNELQKCMHRGLSPQVDCETQWNALYTCRQSTQSEPYYK